jgi:hypothetical protein
MIVSRNVECRFRRDQRRLFCSVSNPSQSIAELLHIAQSDHLFDLSAEQKIQQIGVDLVLRRGAQVVGVPL